MRPFQGLDRVKGTDVTPCDSHSYHILSRCRVSRRVFPTPRLAQVMWFRHQVLPSDPLALQRRLVESTCLALSIAWSLSASFAFQHDGITVKTCSVPFEGLWHIGNSSHLDQSACLNLKETTRLSFSLTTKPWWDPVQLHAIPMFTYWDFLYRIMNQHESIVSCKYRVYKLYRCLDDGILYYKVCILAVTCIRLCLWPPNWESQYQNK